MSIHTKIVLPITLLLIVVIGSFSYMWQDLIKTKTEMNAISLNNQHINDISTRIGLQRDLARQNTLFYRITKDENYLHIIDTSTKEITTLLTELNPLITSTTGKELIAYFLNAREDVARTRNDFIKAIQNGNPILIDKTFRIWEITANNSTARLLDFMRYNQNELYQTQSAYEAILERFLRTGFFIVILTIAMVISFYFYLRQIISRPLQELSVVAQHISQGDFNTPHTINSRDELGLLANNLKIMSISLRKYYHSIHQQMKQKEAEIKRIKEFSAQKNTFMSIASHELKTPVTSLKIFGQLLEQLALKNKHEQYLPYIQKMDNQINKLTGLIVSLLDLTKIRVGKMPFTMQYFDLNICINEALEIQKNASKHAQITYSSHVNKPVYGDVDKIGQVMNNLLSNAIRYSPKGGNVIVTSVMNRSQVTVSVKDFGIGIDKPYQKKIFKRFFRVTGTNEETYPGLGIGLYICADIIKRHQGKLWVESAKDKGSTFSFTLPLNKPKEAR